MEDDMHKMMELYHAALDRLERRLASVNLPVDPVRTKIRFREIQGRVVAEATITLTVGA
jgi:hypothetical protein